MTKILAKRTIKKFSKMKKINSIKIWITAKHFQLISIKRTMSNKDIKTN